MRNCDYEYDYTPHNVRQQFMEINGTHKTVSQLLHIALCPAVRPIEQNKTKLFQQNQIAMGSLDWIIYVPNGGARARRAQPLIVCINQWPQMSRFHCKGNLPVWMYVCFFMSDFWWNRLPQYWHGYGRVSLWISRCVDSVLDLLNVFPHCLHFEKRKTRKEIENWSSDETWNGPSAAQIRIQVPRTTKEKNKNTRFDSSHNHLWIPVGQSSHFTSKTI